MASPNNSVIYSYSSGEIYAVSTLSNKLLATLSLPAQIYSLAITPDGKELFATLESQNSTAIINATSMAVIGYLYTFYAPYGVSISPPLSYVTFSTNHTKYSFKTYTFTNTSGAYTSVYTPSVSSGTVSAGSYVPITFSATTYCSGCVNTTFTESGLPSGYSWTVAYNGTNKTSSLNTITFSTLPGSYSFIVQNLSNATGQCTTVYTASPSSGVQSTGSGKPVTFSGSTSCTTTFVAYGLPDNYKWNVSYDGVNRTGETSYYAYVTDYQNDTVSVINLNSGNVVSSVYAGYSPQYITSSNYSHTVYWQAGIGDYYQLSSLNATSSKSTLSNAYYCCYNLYELSSSPDGRFIYESDYQNVFEFNASSNSIIRSIATDTTSYPAARAVAVLPGDKVLYSPNYQNSDIGIVNLTSGQIITRITGIGTPDYAVASPNGKLVYVSTYTGRYYVLIINTSTNTLVSPNITNVYGNLAITPNGKLLYAADYGPVSRINLSNNNVVSVSGSVSDTGLTVTPDGRLLLATEQTQPGNLQIINISSNSVIKNVRVGVDPTDVAVLGPLSNISITTNQGSYSFVIPTLSNTSNGHTSTYTPNPSSGLLNAGASMSIRFSAAYV